MQDMNENSKYSLMLLIAIVVLVGVAFYFVAPLRQDIDSKQKELTVKQQNLASYQTFATANKDYDTFIKNKKAILAVATEKLPDTVAVSELVKEFSELSKSKGVSLLSVAPPKEESKQVGGAYEVPLKLSVQGNYYKIIDFLQKIEHGARLIVVKQMSVTAANASKNNGDLNISADFVAYSLKKSSASGKEIKKSVQPNVDVNNK